MKEIQSFQRLLREVACFLEEEVKMETLSQDERMFESPVETLEKALGLHFISKMGLTCL